VDEDPVNTPADDDAIAIADHILPGYILPAAADWTNSRIEKEQAQSSEYDLG
jgi:hypothetical protein